ncbi:hypothetical protein Hdeb2414_s0010g00353921 [Helianthus debilis subsp. tardiflorus]
MVQANPQILQEDGQVSQIHDGYQNQMPLNFVLRCYPKGDF